MNVLIIGGTALIGPHVIRELFENNVKSIHTITRSGKNYYCEHSHSADRQDQAALQKIISKFKPDALIDMMPFSAADARILVATLSKLNYTIPVIAVSSIDVYAAYASLHETEKLPLQQCPITESMQLRKNLGPEGSTYDKLSVESIYRSNLQNACILRMPAIYGWPDCTRVSNYVDQMLDKKSKIHIESLQADWKFSRCLHKNAAHAIVLATLARLSGIHAYNVAEEEVFTEREWIQKLATLCGWKGSIIETECGPTSANWRQHFYVTSKKIRTELGYSEKYSPIEGLADTVAFHAYQRINVEYHKYY